MIKRGVDKHNRFYKTLDGKKFYYQTKDYESRRVAKKDAETHSETLNLTKSKVQKKSKVQHSSEEIEEIEENNKVRPNIKIKFRGGTNKIDKDTCSEEFTNVVNCFFCGKDLRDGEDCNC